MKFKSKVVVCLLRDLSVVQNLKSEVDDLCRSIGMIVRIPES